jgi:SAM-dependent methyltransferase
VHDTAYEHGRLFFKLYGSASFRTVVELGSQNVNGSLRDHCPPGVHYIGLDMIPAAGVDVVVNPAAPLPFAPDIADAIVTSSAFEHDVCFWDTFLELTRILRPGGLLYVNAPSNGDFHRYPLDCWRFYPDAGVALVKWAARRNIPLELIESFIGQPRAERWADFVAIFRKPGGAPLAAAGRIADHAPAINVYHRDHPPNAPLEAESASMPDARIAAALTAELTAARQHLATLSHDLAAEQDNRRALSADLAKTSAERDTQRQQNQSLSANLAAAEAHAISLQARTDDLARSLAEVRRELLDMQNSTSWRMTAGLRRLVIILRGH